MKNEKIMMVGVAVGVAFSTLCGICTIMYGRMSKKIKSISKAIDDAADNIDLTVPEDVVKVTMAKAANNACDKVARAEADNISEVIIKKVDDSLNKAYCNIEDDLKQKLEEKISVANLENIEKKVAEKVSKRVLGTSFFSCSGSNGNSSISDIIKTCTESGMSYYEITKILRAAGLSRDN